MKDEYNATVLDHFLNPRNTGQVVPETVFGTAQNQICGDMVRLSLQVERGRIILARARTFGCAAAIAVSSVLTELLMNKSVEDALQLKNSDIVDALGGLPPNKEKCSLIAEEVVRAALENLERPPAESGSPTKVSF